MNFGDAAVLESLLLLLPRFLQVVSVKLMVHQDGLWWYLSGIPYPEWVAVCFVFPGRVVSHDNALMASDDELLYGNASKINPFLPKLLLLSISWQHRNPIRAEEQPVLLPPSHCCSPNFPLLIYEKFLLDRFSLACQAAS